MKKITMIFCIFFLLCETTNANNFIGSKSYSSLEVKYEETPNIALGQTIRIGIIALTEKGKEYKTPGFLLPSILKTAEWAEFTVQVEGGTYEEGAITISSNLADVKNYEVKITAASVKNPEIKNELIIKLNFKGTTLASFDGERGKRGRQGQMGTKGANAVTSSDQAGPAGMGGTGGQGGNGGDGQNIEVNVKLQFDDVMKKEMLFVLVKSKTNGQQSLFLVDPSEGKIIVSANGGDGGSGGDGGQGGMGGDDTYRQSSTNGGQGGMGGNGGNGSNGGSVIVYMDPSTDKLNSGVISFSNEGGSAGRGGSAGNGGSKGSNNNAVNGPQGTAGTSGNSGNKGPEIKIVKQKVEIAIPKTTSSGNSTASTSSTATSQTESTAPSSNSGATTTSSASLVTDASKLPPLDKKKAGYFEEKNSYGKIVKQGYKINGKMEGECREYGGNDKSVYISHYVNDVKEGYSVQYGYDGTLKAEGNYKNDLMEGEWKYYKKGVLTETVTFVEGVQQE